VRPLVRSRLTWILVGALCLTAAACDGHGDATRAALRTQDTSGGNAMSMTLDTTAFAAPASPGAAAAHIPARFAMRAVPGGQNVSIPYSWSSAPHGTRSFALTLVDTAPVAHDWVHWMVVDIPSDAASVPEGASKTSAMPDGAGELRNSFGSAGYGGPQPPPGTGQHPYVATLYALDVAKLGLSADSSLAQFNSAVAGHVLATATCTGTFGR